METLLSCPICGCEKLGAFLDVVDYSITKEIFTISRCSDCDFLFTNPRPESEGISKYYESPDYISHSNSKNGIINKIYQVIRRYSITRKLKLVSRYAGSDKTILDIGCGTGEFLNACQKNGWQTKGVEPNKSALNYCIDKYKLKVVDESEINVIPQKSFKIITLWHVLEHVHTLKRRLENISHILKDNGIAIIAVPNCKSYDALYYEKHWAAYDIPRHLYHFQAANIKQLFIQYGFEWIESFPMKFDSFYVSALSEKYRNSKLALLRALYIGLKSNLIAGKDPEKYSSVIYIFKKNI